MTSHAYDQVLIDDISSYAHDPVGFVNYAFPWGEEGDLEDVKGPRTWQLDVFKELGEHLKNPETRFAPFLFAGAPGDRDWET